VVPVAVLGSHEVPDVVVASIGAGGPVGFASSVGTDVAVDVLATAGGARRRSRT
jgi:hypothetical protein